MKPELKDAPITLVLSYADVEPDPLQEGLFAEEEENEEESKLKKPFSTESHPPPTCPKSGRTPTLRQAHHKGLCTGLALGWLSMLAMWAARKAFLWLAGSMGIPRDALIGLGLLAAIILLLYGRFKSGRTA